MTATLNRAEAGWNDPPVSNSGPGRELAPVPLSDNGRNALQALFAFASVQQQAAKHRALKDSPSSSDATSSEAELALDEILHSVAERALSITGADGVAIALAEDNAILCRASAGRIAPDSGIKLDPDSGFSGACLRSGETVRCDDSETDPRVNPQACRDLGARSMIAVPLSAKQHIVGLIEAFSTETFGFNDKDVRSLNLLGELILAAIRPEEEDRLAELARKVVAPPAPAQSQDIPPDQVLVTIPHIPARVIVDEKFAPLQKESVAAQTAVEAAPVEETLAAPAPALEPELAPSTLFGKTIEETPEDPARSASRVPLIAALVLIFIALAAAAVWKTKYAESSSNPALATVPSAAQPDQTAPLAPAQTPLAPAPEEAGKSSAISKVTAVHHSSSDAASTVVIDLESQVQYEEHTLDNPPRVYFDLHDTRIGSGPGAQDIEVNDAFLKRIRMAQPSDGVTRIVLETKANSQLSVSLGSNPSRLTIEVHKAAAIPSLAPGTTAPPAALPKPSPAIVKPPKTSAKSKPTPSLSPAEFQIVLDAGHGGWDLGTVGRKGLLEKDLVLDIVQRLGKLIETRMGVQVIYTRQDDSYLPLEKRAEIANLAKADMFLSVHANYSDLASARGVETYYTTTYSSLRARTEDDNSSLKDVDWTGVDIRSKVTESHHLAADIQQSLYSGLAANNPEIRNRGVKEAQYVVLTGTQMPAVLAEVSFVSSPADETRLENSAYRQQIAEALYRGVAQYHREVTHTKLASAKKPQR